MRLPQVTRLSLGLRYLGSAGAGLCLFSGGMGGSRPFVDALGIVAVFGGECGSRLPDLFKEFVFHEVSWVSADTSQASAQTWVAQATSLCRPATRRTEWVRRGVVPSAPEPKYVSLHSAGPVARRHGRVARATRRRRNVRVSVAPEQTISILGWGAQPRWNGRPVRQDRCTRVSRFISRANRVKLLTALARDSNSYSARSGHSRGASGSRIPATESLFEKSFEPRGTEFGVPRLRGPLVALRPNRVNAELQTGFSNRL